jgi:CRP-like cAMP-binding protein
MTRTTDSSRGGAGISRAAEAGAVLRQCPLFDGAGEADIEALAHITSPVTWPAGTVIFQQGDPGEFMGIIVKGRVRLGLITAAGRELTLRHADHGEVIGEMGVLDHQDRSADATAMTETQALVIRRAAFDRLLAERPELARTVIRYLSRRLRETTYQLESVALYELTARLARFLLATLRQVHCDKLGATAALTLDLGQSDIAAILGASRPKLNRAFISLIDSGVITRDGRTLTCKVEELEDIAAADEA